MKRLAIICFLLLVSQGFCTARPWLNKNLTPEERAKLLLGQMTLDEKLFMVHGHQGQYVGNVPANTRLGIPALTLNDGPQVKFF